MLRVVWLTAHASGNAARIAHYVARQADDNVRIVAAIIDKQEHHDRRRQLDRLRTWYALGGLPYALWRLWLSVRPRIVAQPPRALYARSLYELGAEFGFEVIDVPSINSPQTEEALKRLQPDIAVSIGNQIIQQRIFSLPTQGTINLHHGKIPEYRGGPPGFWELHDGSTNMGVSVHRVDDHVDHGELLAEASVQVFSGDTPRTLMERAYKVDHRLILRALEQLAKNHLDPISRDLSRSRVRTIPSRRELRRVKTYVGGPIDPHDYRFARLEEAPLD